MRTGRRAAAALLLQFQHLFGRDNAIVVEIVFVEFGRFFRRPGGRVLVHRDLAVPVHVFFQEPTWQALRQSLPRRQETPGFVQRFRFRCRTRRA